MSPAADGPWPPRSPPPPDVPPRPRDRGQADLVGVWAAAVWILVGTHYYWSEPQRFAGWKGALYYVAGTLVVALLGGLVTRTLHRGVGSMLAEVFPKRDRFTDMVGLLLRLMLRAAEGLVVALFARWALWALG